MRQAGRRLLSRAWCPVGPHSGANVHLLQSTLSSGGWFLSAVLGGLPHHSDSTVGVISSNLPSGAWYATSNQGPNDAAAHLQQPPALLAAATQSCDTSRIATAAARLDFNEISQQSSSSSHSSQRHSSSRVERHMPAAAPRATTPAALTWHAAPTCQYYHQRCASYQLQQGGWWQQLDGPSSSSCSSRQHQRPLCWPSQQHQAYSTTAGLLYQQQRQQQPPGTLHHTGTSQSSCGPISHNQTALPNQPLAAHNSSQQQQQQSSPGSLPPGGSWSSLPNLLSLSRVAAAPLLVWLVLQEAWGPAATLVAAAAVSDWADGHLARRLGHTSVLGSYLDPLGDKIFIGALVGALGWQGSVPGWLVALVLGRDVALLGGMTAHRLHMFRGRWPGWSAFLDADGAAAAAGKKQPDVEQGGGLGSSKQEVQGSTDAAAGAATDQEQAGAAAAAAGGSEGRPAGGGAGGLPRMQPLFISKVNTALVFLLLGGCITQQWQGWPGGDVMQALEWTVAGTTAASGLMYGVQYSRGMLLPRQ